MASAQPVTALSKLKPRDFQAVICVRVVRKWNFTGRYENGPTLHVDLVLADAEGNVIYAEIPRSEIESKSSLLEVGQIYTISRFRVKAAKSSYMPFPADTMIEFSCYTKVALANNPPDTFPAYVQRVIPFNEIRQHVREHPDFIDVIGILVRTDLPSIMRVPGRPDTSITRDITIRDLQDRDLKVTLWGQRSKNFNIDELYDQNNPRAIVVLFVGCVTKEFQRIVHVSGNNACHWYFNPPIQEAQPFYARFKDQHFPIVFPTPTTAELQDTGEPIVIEHKLLHELNDLDPYHFPVSGFHCTVTVTDVPRDDSWWYLGCRGCKKSSSEYVGGAPWCKTCKTADFKPRYKLTFTATDSSAQGQFFCFDNIAQQIVKKSCETLLQLANKTSGPRGPLGAILSNKFTFAVGLTTESYHSSSKTYLINAIIEDYQRQVPARGSTTDQRSINILTPSSALTVASASTMPPQTPPALSAASPRGSASVATPTEATGGTSNPSTTPASVEQLHTLAPTEKSTALAACADQVSDDGLLRSASHTKEKNVKRKIVADDTSVEQEEQESAELSEQNPVISVTVVETAREKNKLPARSQGGSASQPKRSKHRDVELPGNTEACTAPSGQHHKA